MMWWAVFFVLGILFPSYSILAQLFGFGALMCAGCIRCGPGDRPLLWRFVLVSATALLVHGGAADSPGGLADLRDMHVMLGPCLRVCERARAGLLDSLDDPILDEKSRRLLTALLLGSRDRLGYELREAFSYLGIAHFLALSGLHLGIVLIPVSQIISLSPLGRRSRYLVIFFFVLAYAAVARFPASLIRATALAGAFLLMRSLGRKTTLMRALVAGCFAAATIDGRIVFDAGFRLSFAAVCGIALVALPIIYRFKRLLPDNGLGRAVRVCTAPLIVTFSINLFTLPLVLSLFHRAPLLAPLFNILMILPVTAAIYLGTAYLLIPSEPVRSVLAIPIDKAAHLLWHLPMRLSRSPQPALLAGDVNIWIYVSGLSLLIYALKKGSGRCLVYASVLILSAFALAGLGRSTEDNDARPIMERLSKGSVLVSDRKSLLVVDRHLSRFEAMRAVRALWARNMAGVEVLIICPANLGNPGGIEHLASRITIQKAVCNPFLSAGAPGALDMLRRAGISVDIPLEDLTLDLGRASLVLDAPPYPPAPSQSVADSVAFMRYSLVKASHRLEKAN